MTTSFRGKIVWITGASSGIGRALAHAFGRAGARVILSARNVEALRAVAGEVGGETRIIALDLNDLASIPAAAAQALNEFGGVDIMVHNAGVAVRGRAAELTLEVHERVLRTNYLGPVVLTQALLPSMRAQGAGRFVVVGSLAGKYGGPLLAAYVGSKHALQGYFDTLRGEEREAGISVTIIIPGFVRTEITAHALTDTGEPFGRVLPVYHDAMTAEQCAARILRAVASGRREVLVGGLETWTAYLQRLSPRLATLVVWGHPVRWKNRLLAPWRALSRRLGGSRGRG